MANGPAAGTVPGITYCLVRALTFQDWRKKLFVEVFQVGVKSHDMPSSFDGPFLWKDLLDNLRLTILQASHIVTQFWGTWFN